MFVGCHCNDLFKEPPASEIPRYIERLIDDFNEKEPLQVSDVVLIDLGIQSDILSGLIAEAIPKKNALTIPVTEIFSENQRIRQASFLIVVTDIIDEASYFLFSFDAFYQKHDF